MTSVNQPNSIYAFDCIDLYGKSIPLSVYKGRPILVVNTASLCGFSPQFKGLEEIWQKNQDKGLVVLGVPSGDFGKQELGSNAAIVTMCSTKFRVSFPLLAKTHVRGSDAHPLFQWLSKESGFLGRPRWNFYKYLIGRDGKLKNWFCSFTAPETPRFTKAVNDLTAKA